jgi:PhnB protein
LDAKVRSITNYADIPEFPGLSFAEKILDCVAYATLKIGQTELKIYDSPGFSRQIGNQVAIHLTTTNSEKTKQIFEALQKEGKVIGPLERTSFTSAQGMVMEIISRSNSAMLAIVLKKKRPIYHLLLKQLFPNSDKASILGKMLKGRVWGLENDKNK